VLPLSHIFAAAAKSAVTRLTLGKIFALGLLAYGGAPAAAAGCAGAAEAVDRLVCGEPTLAALDAAMAGALAASQKRVRNPGERQARLDEQRRWLAGRAAACPAAASSSSAAVAADPGAEAATACLVRLYAQRAGVLGFESNTAAWPRLRFRPSLVEGAGTRLCEDLGRDLAASFLGPGAVVDPLGERAIGFAPVAGLGDGPRVLRADIDAYNQGAPFPVLLWLDDADAGATAEYRAFGSAAELSSAMLRGRQLPAQSLHAASRPLIEIAKLPRPDPGKEPAGPRAFFADNPVVAAADMPRFFREGDRIYLLAPMKPAAGKPGDLGVYRLMGPAQLHRLCVFALHTPEAAAADPALAPPEMEALKRAVAPLLPSGRLCPVGDAARILAEEAAWRPWALDQGGSPGAIAAGRVVLYLRNRALTGPEAARQYRAYAAARGATVEALTPFYIREFGRTAADAKRLASIYLDRLVAGGFRLDPDDEAATALLAPEYAERHQLQQLALAGETDALRAALGPEPKAVAKGVQDDLDETLPTDALEHPQTLRMLLDQGLDPNEPGASGRTALMVAARLDLVEAAGILLARGAVADLAAGEAVAQTDRGGDPACNESGAPSGDAPGRTALSYAAERASPEMVRLLLAHGAAVDKPDSAGRRPADYAKARGDAAARAAAVLELLK
jgi:uncharacterized protein YecT (DUF1311 family)